jgi:hypothetical protein
MMLIEEYVHFWGLTVTSVLLSGYITYRYIKRKNNK